MNWCFSLHHTETKNLVYFFQYTEKWLEIQPVTGDFVSSAAQRESLLAIYSELANQRAQKALFTFVAYTNWQPSTWVHSQGEIKFRTIFTGSRSSIDTAHGLWPLRFPPLFRDAVIG